MTTVTDADRKLVETILNAYHTTRLKGADPVEHILSKGTVQKELANYREAEVAKIVAWLRGVSDANNGSTIQDRRLAYQIAAATFADAIEAGEYRND